MCYGWFCWLMFLERIQNCPFDGGVELPRVAVTSYGVKLRVPIHEVDGITIAVILCQWEGRNFGLVLTRDIDGKDPTRPRYFAGCRYTDPNTGPARYIARLADLGDDLYNLTFNGKPLKASWRTIYVVPTATDLDSASSTTPNLIMNCNPASHFRIPRWLIAQFTTLKFEVTQVQNTTTLQVLYFRHPVEGRIYVSLGSCTEHHDDDPDRPPLLWAKVDVLLLGGTTDTFTHDCSEDHIDYEPWKMRSRVFGDADWGVRLSLTPSTQMPDSMFVVHLELLGRVSKTMCRESGPLPIFASALADIDMDTPRPLTPNSDPATSSRLPSQLHTRSIIPQKPSKGSTVTLHRWFPSVPRPVRKRGPDIPIPALESKLHMLTLDVDEPIPSGAAVAQGPAVRSSVTTQTGSGSDGEADESVVGAQILGERGFRGL